MKREFRTQAQHLSFEKIRKYNLCSSYRKLFKQIRMYINYIFLMKISKNKENALRWANEWFYYLQQVKQEIW